MVTRAVPACRRRGNRPPPAPRTFRRAARVLRLAVAVCGALAFPLFPSSATDYYVATTGSDDNDGSAGAPFATIDKAVRQAVAHDNIHVAPGVYETNTENGPALRANLIGGGGTRDATVIRAGNLAAANYRTLKMEAGSLATNLTFIGNTAFQVSMGGTVYMAGGTIRDCVIRDGTCKTGGSSNNAGGNVYCAAADCLIENCEISGGSARNRGGNVCLDRGTLRGCFISGGIASGGSDNSGGNVWTYQGKLENCSLAGGQAATGGNLYLHNAGASCADCTIQGGSASSGGNVYNRGRLTRCTITGGDCTDSNMGGGVRNNGSSALLEDCLIAGNADGGLLQEGSAQIYSCTIVGNTGMGVFGYGSASKSTIWFNTVVFGNTGDAAEIRPWRGDQPTLMTSCALDSQDMAARATYADCVYLGNPDAFADYANGDYRPSPGSALIDAGTADPRGAAASATDLGGNARTSGAIDIGCYEVKKAEMVVHIVDAAYSQAFAPETVTFTHSTVNSGWPENVVFTYDFGDGSATAATRDGTISHTYAAPGVYTVTINADNDCEEEFATMTYDGYVRVASPVVYVTPGNAAAGTFPNDTPETGYGSLKTAVQAALDGQTLLLQPGVHETSDQISFSKAIVLRGTGATPEDVVVRNLSAPPDSASHRTLEMNNAAARIENIVIENGCVRNQFGGNLRLVTGVVSNCVIRGGLAVADDGNAAGAGVELAGAGTLTHCVVSNNVVQGTSGSGSYAGGAVFIQYNAKNGRVSNCLVVHNRYVTSGDTVKAGAAGIRFGGSNDNTQIENNTVAANTVEGSLADDSAGIHCTTWFGRLRNNLVAGNYETGKERYTSVRMDVEHGTYLNNVTDADGPATTLFKDFAHGDFAINPLGAACNAGTLTGLTLLPSADLAGNPRVMFGAIDVGCQECQTPPPSLMIVR